MSKSIKRKIIAGILAITIISACKPLANTTPATVSTVTPRPTYAIDDRLTMSGILVPRQKVQLAFAASGRLETIFVEVGDVVHIGDALAQLDTKGLEAFVVRADYAFKVAQAEYENSKRQSAPPEMQTAAAGRVEIAKADLTIARFNLEQASLIAPFDGVVMDVMAVPGEMVNPQRTVITLANLSAFQAETIDLNAMDIRRIHIGQSVEVIVGALDLKIDGVVEKIIPKTVAPGEDSVYRVVIALNDQPPGLYWGLGVDIKFSANP